MKFRQILILTASALLSVIACKKPVDLGPEKVEISPNAPVTVAKDGGSVAISLTATVDWQIKGDVPEWINVSPNNGKASAQSQTITITVLPNTESERSAELNFYGNIMCSASLTVNQESGRLAPKQEGKGTADDPYNVAAVKALAEGLDAEGKVENVYTIGIVSTIKNIDTSDFGNAEYCISDDGTTEGEFIVYRGYYLGGKKFTSADQLKVGDEVIVLGTIVNFKGNTPEYTSGSKIVSLNGETAAEEEILGELPEGLKITLGENAYDDGTATINGTPNWKVWKIGTNSKNGNMTITVPAGTTKLFYNAVAWKGSKDVKISFTPEGGEAISCSVTANDGASGNHPYTINVETEDSYGLINLDCKKETKIEITANSRVIFWDFDVE